MEKEGHTEDGALKLLYRLPRACGSEAKERVIGRAVGLQGALPQDAGMPKPSNLRQENKL